MIAIKQTLIAKEIVLVIRFTDGMEFDTSGPLQIVEKIDGFYVVGKGWLIPVSGENEGNEVIRQLKEQNKPELIIELSGPTGNAYYILGATMQLLQSEGREDATANYLKEATSGNYEHLLEVTRRYVNLICK
jgi:hypothetical protein